MNQQTDPASTAVRATPAHVEHTTSVMTGRPILIRCECLLGRDHTYAEWRVCFGVLPGDQD